MEMIFKCGYDQRRYNEPRHEVAAIFVEDEGVPPFKRDIIVYPKDVPTQTISYMPANCDPMCYPIISHQGDLGRIQGMQYN